MSASGGDLHEELSGAHNSSLRKLLSFVTEFAKLFDGCEALIQPMPRVVVPDGGDAEQRELVRAHNNVVPLAGVPRSERSARSEVGSIS